MYDGQTYSKPNLEDVTGDGSVLLLEGEAMSEPSDSAPQSVVGLPGITPLWGLVSTRLSWGAHARHRI
jgi:hypothetical protein